ncbi:MAG TPA: FtsX-like permease family protein, partial [Epulopiscium sp.]|nr:FtsX-like permease family protein [Candidatus Epulonipiscium sp.]
MLLRKAIRSMLSHKKAYLSCILLMAIGVLTYTMMNTALTEMDSGKVTYYEEMRLGDAFATVAQIPKTALSKLAEIEGIEQVDGRLIETIRVVLPGNKEDVIRLRLISTIPGENHKRLNAYVQTGNDIINNDDLLVGYDFYNAYNYQPGDIITLIINQQNHNFKVQGYVYSPEYVYIVENPADLFSDTTKYNIAYMDEDTMMGTLGMEGIYNDLSFSFSDGVTYEDIKGKLEYELKKYGLISLFEKEDLFSYDMLEQEISSGLSMATTLPMAFVSMAAIVLYLMLKRMIEQDRAQIGTLRAFGYSKGAVLRHYILYGLITGIIGAILGLLGSYILVTPFIEFYLSYFKLPISSQVQNYKFFYIGGFWSVVGGGIGAYFGAKNILSLSPADALRPKAPKAIKRDILKHFPFLPYILTSRGLMTLRNITRNTVRSSFIVMGITFSYSMMVMIGMMSGLITSMFTNQFEHVLKYNTEIVLSKPVPYNQGIQSTHEIDEIDYTEGILKIPVSLHNGHKKTVSHLVGIKDGNYLYKIYDDDRKNNLQLSKSGLILSSILANSLDVQKNDFITIKTPYLNKDFRIKVDDVVVQSMGSSAYIDLDLFSNLLGEQISTNSLIVKSDQSNIIREKLVYSESVTKIEDKTKTLEFYETMLGSYNVMLYIIQLLAIVIGFTIIYNTSVISLSERSREYATLRVLGLDVKEVQEIMSFEYWILCFIGILLGIPFAYLLNTSLINMIDI